MRASVAVAKVKEQLRNSTTWSTAELASYINRHVHALVRKMVETDEGYFNFTFALAATSARRAHLDVWEYTIPQWVMKIVEVRELSTAAAPTGAGIGIAIPFISKFETCGLRFAGPNVLQLKGFAAAKDLEIRCAKRPAKITLGTLPVQTNLTSPATSYVRIDADTSASAADYPHETLPNSYANALLEITGQTARSGQLVRCTGSTHFQDESGTLYTVLQVEPSWTTQPLAADTYELHVEIPEEHMQLVILLAAYTAHSTRGATDEIKTLSPLISEQMSEFQRHITPRQMANPMYLLHSIMPERVAGLRNEDSRIPLWS